jgi:uncharacterized tellurite resistance protein B-like protein
MPDENSNPEAAKSVPQRPVEKIETELLRFLCQEKSAASSCREIIHALRTYTFTAVPHQVLFDCLKKLPVAQPDIIAAELPARLVRAGFPDFDLHRYFSGEPPDEEQARMLCHMLRPDAGEQIIDHAPERKRVPGMSFWKMLGFDPKSLNGNNAGKVKAETETVRKIVAELDAAEPQQARFMAAFAYLLTRVAYADHEISAEESAVIEQIVRERGNFTEAQAVLVAQIARTQNRLFAGTENFLVAREFANMATKEQKLYLIDCLYAVCSADRSISVLEDNEISKIANELHLDHPDFIAVRLQHRDKLAVLRE